jgi:hypothetical protein
MNESKSAKKPARKKGAHYFDDDLLADFCFLSSEFIDSF